MTRTFLVGMIFTVTVGPIGVRADTPLYGPKEKVEGKTLTEWSAAYFEWVLPIKKNRNPAADRTGEFAAEGQKGPVWFLGGSLGDVSERKIRVPAGKPIISPIIFTFTADLDGPLGEKDALRLKQKGNRFTDMSLVLDGKDLGKVDGYRVAVPPTKISLPESPDEAIFAPFAGKRTFIANGYWFILKPLAEGEHNLRIRGRSPAQPAERQAEFKLDLTYKITVEKK